MLQPLEEGDMEEATNEEAAAAKESLMSNRDFYVRFTNLRLSYFLIFSVDNNWRCWVLGRSVCDGGDVLANGAG